jgi:hypothetical protein
VERVTRLREKGHSYRCYRRSVRRDELDAAGIQVPVLATVVIGALPRPEGWASRLERIGVDVVSSGRSGDSAESVREVVAAAPHRPALARVAPGADPVALVAAGARVLVMDGLAPAGAYALRPGEHAVYPVSADAPAENANDVARTVLDAARGGRASAIWVAAPDMSDVPEAVAEAKLRALVDGARMARMWLAKQQSDPD